MIADTGAGLYACKASVRPVRPRKDDLIAEVQDIITVGEFYEMAAGGQIIFTDVRRSSAQPVPQELGGDGDGEDAHSAADQDIGGAGIASGLRGSRRRCRRDPADAGGPFRRYRTVADGRAA